MRVIILNVQAPFVRGGAEYLADSLRDKIEARGHRVEIVRVPFKWYPASVIPRQIMACRLLRLDAAYSPDLVIALKFPAYLVPAPRKKLWLLHQFRQAYDLWGTPYQDLPSTPEGVAVRDMVRAADNRYLREVEAIYTNSRIVAGRLKRFNGIEATGVLYPPLLEPEQFGPGEFGDYFFYPSRITAGKRQSLAIEAMRHLPASTRLVLAGRPDTAAYGEELAALVRRYDLEDRVTFLGWISEAEKARLMAGARGVLYLPYDEDSYGYVTLEAFHSGKPVVTLTDAGGIDELVEDGVNGRIVAPTPDTLAEAMAALWADRAQAAALGQAAEQTLAAKGIAWDHVLEQLLA